MGISIPICLVFKFSAHSEFAVSHCLDHLQDTRWCGLGARAGWQRDGRRTLQPHGHSPTGTAKLIDHCSYFAYD